MRKLFGDPRRKPSLLSLLFLRIGVVIHQRVTIWAAWIGERYARLSRRAKIWWLCFFILMYGGGSLFCIVSPFVRTTNNGVLVDTVTSLQHVGVTDSVRINRGFVLPLDAQERLRQFRHYLDSLQLSSQGHRKFDSIRALRPGLMDSLAMIEKLYH